MSTIKDVAKLAGVSVATVSRVVNHSPKTSESAKNAVMAAMASLEYRPNANARALVNQSTDTMGVIVGDVSEPFFGAMVKGVEMIAREHHQHLLFGNGFHSAEQEREAIELLISKRCDTFVIHSKALSDDYLLELVKQFKGMVFINRLLEQAPERCVSLDNTLGTYIATQHLIKLGHRHIAFINSNYMISDAVERLAGYQLALSEQGIDFDPKITASGAPNESGGEYACTELLAKKLRFSALVMYNDAMSAGAISVLSDNRLEVPEDVSVIGFDDFLFARYLRPKLTTMRYPIEMMAMQAASLAINLSRSVPKPMAHPQVFKPVLVSRNSVSALRNKSY